MAKCVLQQRLCVPLEISNMIDPKAVIDSAAEIDENVTIGPFSVIGPGVRIGAGTNIGSHVVIKGETTIGRDNRFFQFSSIGENPQDKKYAGEVTYLTIGDNNVFREFCTVNRGTTKMAVLLVLVAITCLWRTRMWRMIVTLATTLLWRMQHRLVGMFI